MQMKKDNPDKLTPSETIIIQPEEDNYPLSKDPTSKSSQIEKPDTTKPSSPTTPASPSTSQGSDLIKNRDTCTVDLECQSGYCNPDTEKCEDDPLLLDQWWGNILDWLDGTSSPSDVIANKIPDAQQPFELPPDWEEMGLNESDYRALYGLDSNLLDYGFWCERNEECQSNYCDPDMSVCAEPPTNSPIQTLEDAWNNIFGWADIFDWFSNTPKEIGESCDVPGDCISGNCDQVWFICAEPEIQTLPNTPKENTVPEQVNSKRDIVGDSKYTLSSGTYNDLPATDYRSSDTGEILGYTQNGKYYRTSLPSKEGTEFIRNSDKTISTQNSEGNNKIYYLKDGKWYEQLGEGSEEPSKLVDDKKLEMQLSETYSVPEGYMFIPSTKPAGQSMNIGDDCTDDSDCASNFCDKSDIIWVCGKAEFASSPIAFGNCIPGESQNYPKTCEYCNEETSTWTDWCAEQGQICGQDEVGTCYDCVDESGVFYYQQEEEPRSCSTCNSDGSWQYYCPDNTYCSDSGNGKCYPLDELIPPSERECDPEDPNDNFDPVSCTNCLYDSDLGTGKWIPYCDSSTQYCDGDGTCIDLTQEQIDANNAADTMTGCYDNGDYYEVGDEYWEPCPDGISSYVWGTCTGVDEWNSDDNWISYELYCGSYDYAWTDQDCVDAYGELYFYDAASDTCYYDNGDYAVDSSYDNTDTSTPEEVQYDDPCTGDETGCCPDWEQTCLDCYYADWYDQWYYC